jgi:hypothetical protein
VDTRVSSSPLLYAEILSKHGGSHMAKARVTPLTVVEDFDVLPDRSFRLSPKLRRVLLMSFHFFSAIYIAFLFALLSFSYAHLSRLPKLNIK